MFPQQRETRVCKHVIIPPPLSPCAISLADFLPSRLSAVSTLQMLQRGSENAQVRSRLEGSIKSQVKSKRT